MVKRYMFTGYYEEKKIEIKENSNYISYAFSDGMVFVYFETDGVVTPEEVLEKNVKIPLKEFPTGEKWVQMVDIFHYSHPVNDEYWERKEKNKKAVYKIARLKYEEASKYIYYHYKGQQTFAYRHEKYGAIFMYRNIIIIYDEFPMEKAEYELVPGQWSDEDVLAEYDGNIIQDVSLDWEDGTNGWRECEY